MKKRTFILTALTVITFTMTGCQTAPKENAARIADQTKTAAQMNADAPVSSPAAASERSSSKLTDADAKEIAFKDAGLKEADQTKTAAQMNADAPVSSPAAASERSSSKLTDADAKEIAFKDAGLKEDSVTHIRVQKDYDDGVTVYDVEFYAGTTEYDYEIDASTGEIRSRDFDIEHDFSSDKTETSGSTDLLSEEKASKLVLSKVEGASAQNLRIVLDFDIEHDFSSDKTETSGSTDLLSEEKASKLVLSKVEGASAQNLRIVLEHDDGQEIYEGEIRYNGMEYEFELNAKTGDILEWSQEREDD